METTRRNLLKSGIALGLASLGYVGTLVPELRAARAKEVPKARIDVLTGTGLTAATDAVLAKAHIGPLHAHLTSLGFGRTGDDQVITIWTEERGQDQLAHIWYASAAGARARLVDLSSDPNAAAISIINGDNPSSFTADTHRAINGKITHIEHGEVNHGVGTVTFVLTGISQPIDLRTLPVQTAGGTGPVLDVEACWGSYCGPPCQWLSGHACSITCGVTGTLFCTVCCWWSPPVGVVCGLAWVFICEYGWSCHMLSCCIVGACCC